ncbi:MAG: tetratricopeptide repeat protein [Pseudanabaena sp. ELA645]|jgi:tetratricopeptide (TPR) repeat protein
MQRKMKALQTLLVSFGLSVIGTLTFSEIAAANVRIVLLSGKATVIRNGGGPQAAKFGMVLNNGDVVKPDYDTVLQVSCPDRSVRNVEQGVLSGLSKICPQSKVAFASRAETYNPLEEDDFLKFVDLRFYSLVLLDGKQAIRLPEVKGATGYRVQLGTKQEKLLDRQVTGDKVAYAGEKALQPDIEYNFQATALTKTDAPEFRLRFKVLSPSKSKALAKKLAPVESNKDLPVVAKAIALAEIYGEFGLTEQAIAALEKVSQSEKPVALVERLLGNFSLQIGLRSKAEAYYQNALTLAKTEQNNEVIADTQVGLAKLQVLSGDKKSAQTTLQQALVSYTSLENAKKKQQIAEWLGKLAKS